MKDLLSLVGKFTVKLGQKMSSPYKIHCISYMRGCSMGEHSNYFRIRVAMNGGHQLHLVISIGAPREITFSANKVEKGMRDREGTRFPGLKFTITTGRLVSAYLMTSHGNGGCFLCYADNNKNVAVQAQHSVKQLNKESSGGNTRAVGSAAV